MSSAARVAFANGSASLLLAAAAVITARTLGPGGRGAIALISTTATYLMLISSLGTPISARVLLGQPNPASLVRQYLGLSTVLVAVQVIVAAAAVQIILTRSDVPINLPEDILAGLYGGALMGGYVLQNSLYGIGANDEAAAVQAGGAAMQLLGISALAIAGVASVWPYVVAMLGGALFQIAVSIAVFLRLGFGVRPAFGRNAWLNLIRNGIPAIGLTLGQAAVLRVDRILIGLFLAASPVGIYSIAATGTEIVWLVPMALSQILFHRFASHSIDATAARHGRTISLAFGSLTAFAMFAIAPQAVNLVVGPQFATAVTPLRVLLLGAVLLSSYQMDAFALAGRGRIGAAASATVIGFVIVLIADLALIPTRGIVGAAWASVIAYGSMALAVRLFVMRFPPSLEVPHPPGSSPK